MAKVLLLTIHDPFAQGILCLSAYLRQRGHSAYMCFIGDSADSVSQAYAKTATALDIVQTDLHRHSRLLQYAQERIEVHGIKHEQIHQNALATMSEYANQLAPDIIGISCRLWVSHLVPDVLATLKKATPEAVFIAGGMGPSAAPEKFLDMGFDLIGRGEGEQCLLDVCNACDAGVTYTDINNLVYRNGTNIVYNAISPMQENLGALPVPLWDDESVAFISNDGKLFPGVEAFKYNTTYYCLCGRGCPGNCSYCASATHYAIYTKEKLKAPRYRKRPLNSVFDELRRAKNEKRPTYIRFTDEYLIRPLDELLELFEFYNEEIALPFTGYLNPSQLHKSQLLYNVVAKYLARLPIGLQTGCKEFNSKVFNRHDNMRDVIACIKACTSRYIPVELHLISGLPTDMFGETEKNAEFDTIKQLPQNERWLSPLFQWRIMRYFPAENTPLLARYPQLRHYKQSVPDFLYDCLMRGFRRLYQADDDAFEQVRNREDFKNDPVRMGEFYDEELRRCHQLYLEQQAKRLDGQEVYFWGAGEVYKKNKHLFAGLKPKGLLVGRYWYKKMGIASIDGIKLMVAENIFAEKEIPPVIFFSKHDHRGAAFTSWRTGRWNYGGAGELILCGDLDNPPQL